MSPAKPSFKMIWRIILMYSVSLIAVLITDSAINFACGPEKDPYDYYISFYHYNQSPQSSYRSFYFTMLTLLYDDRDPSDEPAVNADEWATYLGRRVKPGDVLTAMYNLGNKTDSIMLLQYKKGNFNIPDSLKRNTFLHALNQSKNKAARQYYVFTKLTESITAENYDTRWKPLPKNTKLLNTESLNALTNAKTEKDKFLKLRWYYQAQRLLFYVGNHKQSTNIYDKYIEPTPSVSHVKSWALSLKAGAEWRLGDSVKAAYLFTKLFDKCPERRIRAFNDYRHIKVKTADIIKRTRSNHEKAVVYTMESFRQPQIGLTGLEQVYHREPRSPMLGLLLTREVNKLEEAYQSNKLNKNLGYYTGRYSDYFNNNESKTHQSQFVAYIPKLQSFCKRLSTENRCAEPALGDITIAYLNWMQNKNDDGLKVLAAVKDNRLSKKLSDQKQMIKLLLLTQKIRNPDTISESSLPPSLKWLEKKVAAEQKEMPRPRSPYEARFDIFQHRKYAFSSRDFYQRILAPMYLRQHDTTKAALAMLCGALHVKPDGSTGNDYWDGDPLQGFWQGYLHSANACKLLLWKQQPPIDPYLSFMASKLKKLSFDYLNDLLGTAYLREHNYANAFASLKKISHHAMFAPKKNYWDDIEMGDPFIDRICDFPKKYYKGTQSVLRNKLSFARVMYRLQRKAKTDSKNAANYYYKMATGMYNTCMDGNAWGLISYEWYEDDRDHPKRYCHYADFVQAQTAATFYSKAMRLSNNSEFKARCVFMLAKCKQQQRPDLKGDWLDKVKRSKNNPYFAVLKNNYSNTAFFKKAVGECSYLSDYIKGR